jgi:hypothetical protein
MAFMYFSKSAPLCYTRFYAELFTADTYLHDHKFYGHKFVSKYTNVCQDAPRPATRNVRARVTKFADVVTHVTRVRTLRVRARVTKFADIMTRVRHTSRKVC